MYKTNQIPILQINIDYTYYIVRWYLDIDSELNWLFKLSSRSCMKMNVWSALINSKYLQLLRGMWTWDMGQMTYCCHQCSLTCPAPPSHSWSAGPRVRVSRVWSVPPSSVPHQSSATCDYDYKHSGIKFHLYLSGIILQ